MTDPADDFSSPDYWNKGIESDGDLSSADYWNGAIADPAASMGEFSKGAHAGWEQTKGTGYGALALIGDAVGSESLATYGMEGYAEQNKKAEQYQGRITDFADVSGPGDAVDYAFYAIGSGLATTIPAVIGGGAGGIVSKKLLTGYIERETAAAIAGGLAEKEAAQLAAKKVLGMGATAGAYTAGSTQESGSIMGDIYEKTGEMASGPAAAFGAIAGAFEILPVLPILKKLGFGEKAKKEITEKAMAEIAKQSGRKATITSAQEGIAGAAGKTLLGEGATEGIQTMVERLAVQWVDDNQKAFTPEGWHEIANAAISGAFPGAAMGGAGHVLSGGKLVGSKADITYTDPQEGDLVPIDPEGRTLPGGIDKKQASDNAKQESAAKGGDALDQEIAGAQASVNTPVSDPSKTVDDVIASGNEGLKQPPAGLYDTPSVAPVETQTIAGEFPGPVSLELPADRKRRAPKRDADGFLVEDLSTIQPNVPSVQSEERYTGIDGLINAAQDMGFSEEAARLSNAKMLLARSEKLMAGNKKALAKKMEDAANKIITDITEGQHANQYPAVWSAEQTLVGQEGGLPSTSPNFTMPSQPINGSSERVENLLPDQSTANRLEASKAEMTAAAPTVEPAAGQAEIDQLIADKAKADKAIERKSVNTDKDSLVTAVTKLGGLGNDWKQDTIGDTGGNKQVFGVGYLFTKKGTSPDDMATRLHEQGYIPASEMDNLGGVPYLQEKIAAEFGGLETTYATDSRAGRDSLEVEAQSYQEEIEAAQTQAETYKAERDAIEQEQQAFAIEYPEAGSKPEPSRIEKEVDEYYESKSSERALVEAGSQAEEDYQEAGIGHTQAQDARAEAAPELTLTAEQDGKVAKKPSKAIDDKAQIDRERDHFGLDKGEGNVSGLGQNDTQGDLLSAKPKKTALSEIEITDENGNKATADKLIAEMDSRLDSLYELRLCVRK